MLFCRQLALRRAGFRVQEGKRGYALHFQPETRPVHADQCLNVDAGRGREFAEVGGGQYSVVGLTLWVMVLRGNSDRFESVWVVLEDGVDALVAKRLRGGDVV